MPTEKQRTPPKSAQNNAQKVLNWKEEHGDEVEGMTDVGWRRARQIASGDPLSMETIGKIAAFARHEKNATISEDNKNTPWKDAGRVAWLGWGGDSAILDWAPKVMDMEKENFMNKLKRILESDIGVPDSPQKKNAKELPKVFYCRHMQAGTARYDDETILVDTDCMKRMCASMEGLPVYVQHQDVDLENLHEADGYVADCFYNPLDGWLWAKFVAVSDKAQEAIKNGWSVSNAYQPTEFGSGGTKNNVEYDRSIKNAEFTHLAIVDNPRYEDACIMSPADFKEYQAEQQNSFEPYSNSKQKGEHSMKLKFWKRTEVTNAAEADPELTEIEIDGETRKLSDVINEIEEYESKKNESTESDEDNGAEKVNMDEKHMVGDEEMTVAEIIEKYKNMCADEDTENEDGEAEDEDKENEDGEEDAEDKERQNAKAKAKAKAKESGKKELEEMKNAIANGKPKNDAVIETYRTKAQRGIERYGS